MATILLAAVNARYTHSCLALYCLKSALRGLDDSVAIREFSINQDTSDIASRITDVGADVIALSVYIWNSELMKHLIPEIGSRCPGRILVLGGPEVSYNAATWIEAFPCVDHIIIGHGEEAFRRLALNSFRNCEPVIAVPNPPFADMPMPYTREDLAALHARYVYYESSRGCPYSCTYCLSSRSDQKLELKPAGTVAGELDLILRSRPLLVKFVDRTFNASRDHSRAIWSHLIDHHSGGPSAFHFEVHPHLLDEEDFTLLARAPKGLFQFEIGIQSTSSETLAAVKRTGAWEREKEALKRLISLGTIRIHCDLIAGLPFEDMASQARSFNGLYGLGPGHLQLGFLKILPGTEMMETALQYGMEYSDHAPYQVIKNRWLSGTEIVLLERIALLLDRLYNMHRFDMTLGLLAGRFESPFALFREMASFMADAGYTVTRSWEQGARFLLAFLSRRFSGESRFFLDALRWDWCAVSRSAYYPELIRPESVAEIKKRGMVFFNNHAADGAVRYNDMQFPQSDLATSLFFEAESAEFRQGQMKDGACALFLPDKRIVIYSG